VLDNSLPDPLRTIRGYDAALVGRGGLPYDRALLQNFQAAGSADEAEHRASSYWTMAPGAVTREPWLRGVGVLRPPGRASRVRER
jgi:hypothetical protein